MAENPYLKALNEQYTTLQKSITGLQSRAKEANRDLTNEELRSVIEQGEKAKSLFTQIEDLSEIELRNAKVAAMNDRVQSAITAGTQPGGDGGDGDDQGGDQSGGDGPVGDPAFRKLGGGRTLDRDPGTYTRGGQHSFVSDQYRASKMGDKAAAERLNRYTVTMVARAQSDPQLRAVLGAGATTLGAGLVPPVWLAEDFAPVMHKRLRLAKALRQVPWAGPFAWTIPVAGTVAKTSSTVEGVNTTITNPGYGTITVTPTDITGFTEVSRQMLEASNPAVDAVIWGDMLGDFYDNCEILVIAALVAVAGANTATVSAGVLTTTDIMAQRAGILDGIVAIADAPAGDPDLFVGTSARWASYLKLTDTTGRPLILAQAYPAMNPIGQGDLGAAFNNPFQGRLESLNVVTSPSVAASSGFILNSQEHLFSVSPPMQFQFEQPVGPALVRIGVWGYEAVTFARRPKAITKLAYSGS
jgi:hypothetical protein